MWKINKLSEKQKNTDKDTAKNVNISTDGRKFRQKIILNQYKPYAHMKVN